MNEMLYNFLPVFTITDHADGTRSASFNWGGCFSDTYSDNGSDPTYADVDMVCELTDIFGRLLNEATPDLFAIALELDRRNRAEASPDAAERNA
jgi:hypothetical protein